MKAKEFDEVNVRIAEHQDEYETLPAYHDKNEGSMTFCFELDEEEQLEVATNGVIFMKVLTFNQPLQPIAMSVIKEDLITIKDTDMIKDDNEITCGDCDCDEDSKCESKDNKKSYIGCKIITAEPMLCSDFMKNEKGVEIDHEDSKGYKIIYPDGYVSWSPDYAFESAYREISDSEKQIIL